MYTSPRACRMLRNLPPCLSTKRATRASLRVSLEPRLWKETLTTRMNSDRRGRAVRRFSFCGQFHKLAAVPSCARKPSIVQPPCEIKSDPFLARPTELSASGPFLSTAGARRPKRRRERLGVPSPQIRTGNGVGGRLTKFYLY